MRRILLQGQNEVAIRRLPTMFDLMTDLQAKPAAPATPASAAEAYELPVSVEGRSVFLDVDGTLLDIAPRPQDVRVPEELPDDLARLSIHLDGALALVSGRSVALLKTLFPSLRGSLIGLHGAEIARPDGTLAEAPRSPELQRAVEAMRRAAAEWPGVEIEDKGAAFAAHYRLAPGFAEAVEAEMEKLASGLGDGVIIQRGKCVIEIRPTGHDKGSALLALMSRPPFAGRLPIAIGDDLTDEAMFRVVNDLGGLSVRVGTSGGSAASAHVASPDDVRSWIRSLVR